MKLWKMAAVAGLLLCNPTFAEDVNYDAMRDGGYGDVAELLKSMTPEQRQEILRQAAIKQKELEKMSPEEVEALNMQLRGTADTIDMEKVDPAKLDPAKSKSSADIQKDLDAYNRKYKQGKISNAVVKPAN